MSQFVTHEDIAEILDGVGKPEAAAAIRAAGEPAETAVELAEQLAEMAKELTAAQDRLDNLESLLCKRCTAKWEDAS